MFPFVRKPRDAGKTWPGLQQTPQSSPPTELKLALSATLIHGQRGQVDKLRPERAAGAQGCLASEVSVQSMQMCVCLHTGVYLEQKCAQQTPPNATYIPISLPEYVVISL